MDKRVFKLTGPKSPRRFGAKERPVFAKGPESEAVSALRSSARWQRLREAVLSANPLCAVCGHVATEAHHIELAARREDLFFERANIMSLCEACHEKIHGAMKRGIDVKQLMGVSNVER